MKRSLTVAAALTLTSAALALPALALTRNRAYVGPAGAGGAETVGLTLQIKDGVAKRVTRFEWHNISAQCSGSGATATTDTVRKPMTVSSRRKFHGTATFNEGRGTATVSGRVSKNNKRMIGTFRIRGTVTGCLSADTGVVDWQATPPAH